MREIRLRAKTGRAKEAEFPLGRHERTSRRKSPPQEQKKAPIFIGAIKAEGKGLEPSTGFPASDFESVSGRRIPEENGTFRNKRSTCAAVDPDLTAIDDDLRAIIDRWGDLPEAVKAGILAMVRATERG